MKEIGELSTKITLSLDEINVLGNQSNVAMALQQFHQVDLLQHEKREKEVYANYSIRSLTPILTTCRETYELITTRADHNRNYKYVMFVAHIYPVLTMIDV